MKTDVSEKGLEDIIVDHLVAVNGYELGKSDDFDAKFAVDWPKLHGFLLKTQPLQVGELRLHEEGGKLKFLTRLNHEIESRGIVDVLRKGIKWCGKTTTCEQAAKSVIYLDEPEKREHNLLMAKIRPSEILDGAVPRLIDEWQQA